jgi:ubiquinone/menaquinone biosynthesis C-methylase UbiE
MVRIKEAVRKRYASAALEVQASGSCCGPDPAASDGLGPELYAALETEGLPDTARLASLGCGNPTAVAALAEGEVVLDLGSGGGLDVFLSARRVGPTGKVYGLDMTDEMLDLARRNQAEAGIENVEFLKGDIEVIPLPDHSVDVIISNCVINLSEDKPSVFREAHRVLRPGGRFAVTDIVTKRRFTEEEQSDLAAWTGCLAGALYTDDFVSGLEEAGFRDVELEITHEVAPDAVSAIIRATA